ncbi:hypothetical protein PFISCL1PPCAC_26712, partial [Pristionchus fissidentatus]
IRSNLHYKDEIHTTNHHSQFPSFRNASTLSVSSNMFRKTTSTDREFRGQVDVKDLRTKEWIEAVGEAKSG